VWNGYGVCSNLQASSGESPLLHKTTLTTAVMAKGLFPWLDCHALSRECAGITRDGNAHSLSRKCAFPSALLIGGNVHKWPCCVRSVAPSVEVVSENRTFYTVDRKHSLICRARGYPPPSVYWLWQPCTSSTTSCMSPRRTLWTSVSVSKNIEHVRRTTLSLSLSLSSTVGAGLRQQRKQL